jgi:LysR family transcriptional regulator for metE and metH
MIQYFPKLEIRHLAMLVAIDKARTLAEAALELNITPSALTHRLREAERRATLPLVRRGGHPRLTDGGQRLLLGAQRCLAELEVAEREARTAGSAARHIVRLGASTLCGYDWLPALLRHFDVAQPSIDIEVIIDVSLDPVSALRDRRIDVAVMPGRAGGRDVTGLRLFQDELVALVPLAHPKARRRYLDVRDLTSEVYVTDTTTQETGREYERLFEPAGVRPERVLRAGHMEAVIALVRAGLGLTVTTRTGAAPFVSGGGLKVVPLTAAGQYLTWYANVRAACGRASPAREVADALSHVVRDRRA